MWFFVSRRRLALLCCVAVAGVMVRGAGVPAFASDDPSRPYLVAPANPGANSAAYGTQSVASGDNSLAFGVQSTASGSNSWAFGNLSVAAGENSVAMGLQSAVYGNNSTAMGGLSEAAGDNSVAYGMLSMAAGGNSTALGNLSQATGDNRRPSASPAWRAPRTARRSAIRARPPAPTAPRSAPQRGKRNRHGGVRQPEHGQCEDCRGLRRAEQSHRRRRDGARRRQPRAWRQQHGRRHWQHGRRREQLLGRDQFHRERHIVRRARRQREGHGIERGGGGGRTPSRVGPTPPPSERARSQARPTPCRLAVRVTNGG